MCSRLSCVLLLLVPLGVAAHDLRYDVAPGQAVTVTLGFADGSGLSGASYELYLPGEAIPWQVGRTDAGGRLAFLAGDATRWRLKVYSADGHGADLELETDPQGTVQAAERPLFERYGRVITGVSLIFGLFGLVSLFRRKLAA